MKGILFLAAIVSSSNAANILGVFVFPSESHNILGSTLLGNLAKRGHNVTYISPFRTKATYPNFTHIIIDDIRKFQEENMQKNNQKEMSYFENVARLTSLNNIQDIFFESSKIQCFLKSDSKFDLMIHFSGADATLALAHHFDVPVIIFSPVGGVHWIDRYFGNSLSTAYRPGAFSGPFSDDMTFFQRVTNAFVEVLLARALESMRSSINDAIRKYFPKAPPVEQIERRIQMGFINSHVSTETPRPYLPAMVQIGGYHLQDPEPLPQYLKKLLDEATNGTIYLSFGTNVKASALSKDKLEIIMQSLGELPQKVLMKFDKDTLDNKPDNVEISSWYPQRAILSHPNVKLFISHGGYGGCTESLYYGVPMICIPFSVDQPKNCADVQRNGYGIHLPWSKLTTELFGQALQQVLHEDKFISKAKLKSDMYRKQEMNPMDRAAYWVDHVIKYKGAEHLRSKSLDLTWYQYYLLDVIAFVITVLLVVAAIVYYLVKYCFNSVFRLQVKIKRC